MPEPKLENFNQVPEEDQNPIKKTNPLTFIRGGLLETENEGKENVILEKLDISAEQIKHIKSELSNFDEEVNKVEISEQSYPGIPFLTFSKSVSLNNECYKNLNEKERKSLDMSIDSTSLLVTKKNYKILDGYLKRLESYL